MNHTLAQPTLLTITSGWQSCPRSCPPGASRSGRPVRRVSSGLARYLAPGAVFVAESNIVKQDAKGPAKEDAL